MGERGDAFVRRTADQLGGFPQMLADGLAAVVGSCGLRWHGQLDVGDWPGFRRGIVRVYCQCFDGFNAAAAARTTASLHECRKQLKYLWYVLRILESVWSEGMARWGDNVHPLTTLPGDDHDLAMLQAALLDAAPCLKDEHGASALSRVIDGHRERLQAQAMKLGAQVFRDRAAMSRCIETAD